MTASNSDSAVRAASEAGGGEVQPVDPLADVSKWEPAADMPDPADGRLRPTVDERMLQEIGRRAVCREFGPGQVLFKQGQRNAPFYVIERGSVVYFDRGRDREAGERQTYFARAGAGNFVGDVAMFTGEPTMAECRALEPTNVMVLEREQLRELLAQHPEIGDVILRAMLARREWLEKHDYGVVKVLGSRWNPQAFRLRDFLSRNSVPHRWYDVDADPEAAALLKQLGVAPDETPVLVCSRSVVRNPSIEEVAEELGLRPEPDGTVYDLLVIGAGPAGLAAAVYAASEGLSTFVADAESPGGQAGTSSRIENYLGFPLGVSGGELARRAVLQANKFGVTLSAPRAVVRLECGGGHKVAYFPDGSRVEARAVVVATGAKYRRLAAEGCGDFEDSGVYYAASHTEASNCAGEEAVVVGGGNSAGQAAVNLSRYASHVRVVIRGPELRRTMSEYLVSRLENTDNIELMPHTELVSFLGDGRLQNVVARDNRTGELTEIKTGAVFVMIGAEPRTDWLRGCVGLDDHGFVCTGDAARRHPERAQHQGAVGAGRGAGGSRDPLLLETTRPGVFAVGDVRSGSVKRVASAVGEGSMAVRLVHEYLASLARV